MKAALAVLGTASDVGKSVVAAPASASSQSVVFQESEQHFIERRRADCRSGVPSL